MKKHSVLSIVLIILTALVISLSSCNHNKKQPEEKQVYLLYRATEDIGGSEESTLTYTYNEWGDNTLTTKTYKYKSDIATWTSEYDGNHNLIRITVDTGGGTPFVQRELKYDENGNLTERKDYKFPSGVTIYTYTYDEQNRLVLRKQGDKSYIFTYADDGSCIVKPADSEGETELYNKDGKLLERTDGSTRTVYIYDSSGYLTDQDIYLNNSLSSKYIYTRDEHGNNLRTTRISNGIETVLGEYEYKLYTIKTS